MKTILIPTDFSTCAVNALNFASEISQKDQAQIHILHVIEHPVGGTIDPIGVFVPVPENADYIKSLMRNGKENMTSFCESLPRLPITSIELGSPYFKIMEAIENKKIDLVIMGTKGVSGLKETFIGSNAERIVRSATCPVITVNQPSTVSSIKRMAVAVNIKDISDLALERLKELQNLFNAELHLVHINTPNNFERDELILKLLKDTQEKHKLNNTEIHVYNDIDVKEGIISFAEYIDAGLIIMTTHGKKGLAHFIAGSTSEDVVNHAKRPVCTFQG